MEADITRRERATSAIVSAAAVIGPAPALATTSAVPHIAATRTTAVIDCVGTEPGEPISMLKVPA